MSLIKLIVSDLDGVLLNCKEIHYEALNLALGPEFAISREDHIKIYDGLSTKNKLALLSKIKNLPLESHSSINELKQKYTIELLKDFSDINYNIKNIILNIKSKGILFYVASNAIRATIDAVLAKLEITDLVDKIYSNEDVKHSKPHSEIYLKCMVEAGVNPDETLIIEDSKHGREAAVKSGAHVCGVDQSFDFSQERIDSCLEVKESKVKWDGTTDLTVLIPMSGNGSRFKEQNFALPKPLIDVKGQPMIQRVINNLNVKAKFIFIVQKEHYEKYNLKNYLELMSPGCQIVVTEGLTQGAACSTLLAKEFIDNDRHLLIANSDQFIDNFDSCDFLYNAISKDADGSILTFEVQNDPKWSYVKVQDGFVTEVAEKKPISDEATIGVYYFRHGSDYVKYAEEMISANDRTNNEFYVVPSFNYAIQDNKKIITYKIDSKDFHGLGTPEDLKIFLDKNIA
jgi:HAD superfamily hydrolase (TIGR01509 family)